MLYKYIGEQVRRRRQLKKLTQDKLARAADISLSFLGHIERGSRKLSVETLIKLAQALECSADELLGIEMLRCGSTPRDHLLHALHMLELQEKA